MSEFRKLFHNLHFDDYCKNALQSAKVWADFKGGLQGDKFAYLVFQMNQSNPKISDRMHAIIEILDALPRIASHLGLSGVNFTLDPGVSDNRLSDEKIIIGIIVSQT